LSLRCAASRHHVEEWLRFIREHQKQCLVPAILLDRIYQRRVDHGRWVRVGFGGFVRDDVKYFCKIDYYDADGVYGSENPADPAVTTRLLTIIRADEY
jgi:hypothetical protein